MNKEIVNALKTIDSIERRLNVKDSGMKTKDGKVKEVASYLWDWERGGTASGIVENAFFEAREKARSEKRDLNDKNTQKFIVEYAKRELNSFYKDLQKEVNKMLTAGFTFANKEIDRIGRNIK